MGQRKHVSAIFRLFVAKKKKKRLKNTILVLAKLPSTCDSLMVCSQGKHTETFQSMAVLPESVVEQYRTLLQMMISEVSVLSYSPHKFRFILMEKILNDY